MLALFPAILAAGALVACAPATASSTTLTAADVSEPAAPSARESAPAEEPAAEAAPSPLPSPGGERICVATDPFGVTTELFLEWTGEEGKGTLRRRTPSGMVTELPVRAERAGGLVVADGPGPVDLVSHAATVRSIEGKPYMRLGDYNQPWSLCE
jgi:hypothetical protein